MAKGFRTRGKAVAVLSVALAIVALSATFVLANHDFPDVPNSAFYHGDVSWLADRGVTSGFPDGTYKPNNSVTRGQMATFLHKLAGVQVAAGLHITRDGSDLPVIESYFNNVSPGTAPTLSGTGGSYDIDVKFATASKFAMCGVDTNFVDTRDAFCTVSTPGGNTVRVRIYDVSAAGQAPAEFWVLVYGDEF